jgi:hypothetical protein
MRKAVGILIDEATVMETTGDTRFMTADSI